MVGLWPTKLTRPYSLPFREKLTGSLFANACDSSLSYFLCRTLYVCLTFVSFELVSFRACVLQDSCPVGIVFLRLVSFRARVFRTRVRITVLLCLVTFAISVSCTLTAVSRQIHIKQGCFSLHISCKETYFSMI